MELDLDYMKQEEAVNNLVLELCQKYAERLTGLEIDIDGKSIYKNDSNIDQCQSPIEKMFLIAYHDFDSELNTEGMIYNIFPQHQIDKYRVDFYITAGNYFTQKNVKFVVEIDGHDFHEKTKEQAANDKKRERNLLEEVDAVVRFTGSEVFKDPEECVWEVTNIMRRRTL